MTLARFCLVCSILMLLVVGTPEAANITMALATNAPMQAKQVGTPLMKSRHEKILCCGASDKSFRQVTQAVSFQEFLSTNCFCLCKLIENYLADSEVRFTEVPSWLIPWSSSADSVSGAKTLKNPCFTKPCAYIPAAPSPGPTPPRDREREMKAIGVSEMVQQAWVEKTKTQSGQFAAIANLEPGCVALTELTDGGTGVYWLGPQESSDPLRQHVMPLETDPPSSIFSKAGNPHRLRAARLRDTSAELTYMEGLSGIWVSVRLTIELASITTVILLILGTPLAWWLAHSKSMWSDAVATIIVLPPMLPQPVLGFYLLALLGPTGPGGLLASLWGERTLAFNFAGLVIGSVLSALPVVVQPIRNAFATMGD